MLLETQHSAPKLLKEPRIHQWRGDCGGIDGFGALPSPAWSGSRNLHPLPWQPSLGCLSSFPDHPGQAPRGTEVFEAPAAILVSQSPPLLTQHPTRPRTTALTPPWGHTAPAPWPTALDTPKVMMVTFIPSDSPDPFSLLQGARAGLGLLLLDWFFVGFGLALAWLWL